MGLGGLGWAVLSAESRPAQDAALALAGSWVINDELSDDPRARPGELGGTDSRRRGAPGGFGGGPGGFGGFGGRGGRFGGRREAPPDPADMARRREAAQEAMGDLMTAARRMTIAGDADEVVLTYDDGRVVRLIPDGREHAGVAGSAAQVTRTTQWRGETLETEIKLESRIRFRVRQTYELQAAGDKRPAADRDVARQGRPVPRRRARAPPCLRRRRAVGRPRCGPPVDCVPISLAATRSSPSS